MQTAGHRKLRIAIVTETWAPEVNGVAMTLGRIVDGLRRRGHAVHLVRPRQHRGDLPRRDDGFYETLVPGLPLPRYDGLRFGLPARRTLFAEWQRARPDIVHVATEGPLGWSAVGAARGLALPVSSGFHTHFDAYSRHYGAAWFGRAVAGYLRRLHNRTDATLVPTRALAQRLRAEGYDNPCVVSRGVDTGLFDPQRRSAGLRADWRLAEGDLAVVHVGRLAPEKNLDLLFAAFAAIQRVRADARLILVGEGPLRKPLAQRFPQHVFAGLRRGEDLAAHYASADLFLFPSLTETFGNVAAEALASGLGVVAYDCAGAAELIVDGRNGRLAPPDDADAFVDAARSLAADPGELSRLRAAAAPSVGHLDWERVLDCFVELLRRHITGHRRRGGAEEALFAGSD